MSQYPRIDRDKPAKIAPVDCVRCYGHGVYAHYGVCFRCGGARVDPGFRQWGYPRGWSDEQCAAEESKREAAAAAREEKARLKRVAEAERIQAANVAQVPAVAGLLDDAGVLAPNRIEEAGILRVSRLAGSLLWDIARREWSDKQAAVVAKAFERAAGAAARRAAELAASVVPPAGRQEIEGEIVSIKQVDDDRFGIQLKMLVKAAGFKVFGSVPAAIAGDAAPGVRVKFVAEIQPKEVGFGFFKRPSKAAVVA